MTKERDSLFKYQPRDIPALCLTLAFVGWWELKRLPDLIRGKTRTPCSEFPNINWVWSDEDIFS